jgi:hypothetical protein
MPLNNSGTATIGGNTTITGSLLVNGGSTTANFKNTLATSNSNVQLGNDIGTNQAGIALFGSQYTSSNQYRANGGYFYSNLSGGLTLHAEGTNSMYLATNNTAAITIDSSQNINFSGKVQKPNQPAFLAYNSTGVSMTGGGWGILSNSITTKSFDVGSNYNTSNGRFTASVTGKYLFYFGGWSSIASNGDRYGVSVTVNGGSYFFLTGGNYSNVDSPLAGLTIVRDLTAGDYAELYAFSSVSGTWGGGSHGIWWGGYLL